MRVPIPIVILLSLAVVAGVWWHGTRGMDFLTPPPQAKLDEIRLQVQATASKPATSDDPGLDAAEEAPPPPVDSPPPVAADGIAPSPTPNPPELGEYSDISPKSATLYGEMARNLEASGEFPRALLAWERVLDQVPSTDAEKSAAISSIRRLRPTLPAWNSDPSLALPITLHAGTAKRNVAALEPALAKVALELQTASSGILAVSTKITAGADPPDTTNSPPVAIWITGAEDSSPSTDVLSFTLDETESLDQIVLGNAFQLIRSMLARAEPKNPPPPQASPDDDITAVIHSHVTRLSWRNFGLQLNPPGD